MSSILDDTKALLGLEETYTYFDTNIIMGINMALNYLTQIGVGPSEGFKITGRTETWNGFIDDETTLEMVKNYVYLKTKMFFDPPLSSTYVSAVENQLQELTFRINAQVEPIISK